MVCLLVYGIPTFDSESFELELKGRDGLLWESSSTVVDRTSLRSASGEHTIEMILSSMIMFGLLWLQFRPNPFSVFGEHQGSPQEHTMSGLLYLKKRSRPCRA